MSSARATSRRRRIAIFALINDLRGWGAWSPYEKRDPAMQRSFSGAASGKGAIYEWDGNNNVGKGRMEITDTIAALEGRHQAGFHQAVRGPQHRRVHHGCRRATRRA